MFRSATNPSAEVDHARFLLSGCCAEKDLRFSLNGAASEATSAYDSSKSLREAYRILFQQWDLVFAIGDENRGDWLEKILSEWQECSLCHPLAD